MFLLTPVAWPIAKLLLACAAAGRAQDVARLSAGFLLHSTVMRRLDHVLGADHKGRYNFATSPEFSFGRTLDQKAHHGSYCAV